jgi:hypothetical protein
MKLNVAVVFIFLCSSLIAQDLEEGLIGHWLMNNEFDMIDQSNTGQHGYVNGGFFTADRFGTEDQAIMFDGMFSYASLQDSLNHVFSTVDATFSISLWHKTGDALPNLSPLICKYAHTGCGNVQRQWALLIAANEGIRFYFASTPDNVNYRSVSTLSDSVANQPQTWYHIVTTYDGSLDSNNGLDRVKIYVDNVLQEDTLNFAEGTLGDSITTGIARIGLMNYVNPEGGSCGPYHAPGALDDIRIYDRLLTVEEVELLYLEEQNIDTADTVVPPPPPGGTGINDQERFDHSLSIFPTIADNGVCTLSGPAMAKTLALEIISIDGVVVQRRFINQFSGVETIWLGDLSPGNYMVNIRDEDGLQSIKRLVIQ